MKIWTLFSCLFILVSCGKSSSEGKKTIPLSQAQIQNLLNNQKFECASLNGKPCPDGIARVFILDLDDPNLSSVCTGFMVGTNYLVTNHHCISTENECDSTYVSVYNGDSYETAKCRSIVSAEDNGPSLDNKAIDYSIIELDHHLTTASFFSLANSRPSSGQELTAWVVDHKDLFSGRITELECRLESRLPSLELSSCPSILGNSGSPVVNERGDVVGVLWGATAPSFVNEATPLNIRRSLDEYSYVTESIHFEEHI